MLYFARANPSEILVTGTYSYVANILGNPTRDEKEPPKGEIRVRVPWDGYQFFTRQAYRDYVIQLRNKPAGPSPEDRIRIGHLALNEVTLSNHRSGQAESPPPQVFCLDMATPKQTQQLLQRYECI